MWRSSSWRRLSVSCPSATAATAGRWFASAWSWASPTLSGRRRPVPIAESEFEVGCDTVIAAVGQEVDRARAESEGLEINGRGIAVDPRTLATNLPGVFAGGDAVLGSDLAVRAVAAGRIAAISIDQYLGGRPVTGPEELVSIDLRPVDDEERAAIFREIEKAKRVETPESSTPSAVSRASRRSTWACATSRHGAKRSAA